MDANGCSPRSSGLTLRTEQRRAKDGALSIVVVMDPYLKQIQGGDHNRWHPEVAR